jgi:hypothetical protein
MTWSVTNLVSRLCQQLIRCTVKNSQILNLYHHCKQNYHFKQIIMTAKVKQCTKNTLLIMYHKADCIFWFLTVWQGTCWKINHVTASVNRQRNYSIPISLFLRLLQLPLKHTALCHLPTEKFNSSNSVINDNKIRKLCWRKLNILFM